MAGHWFCRIGVASDLSKLWQCAGLPATPRRLNSNTGACVYKIAFYSPLKPATHPVPSGDRLMAQLLVHCLGSLGHDVKTASTLRAFLRDPDSESDAAELQQQAQQEVRRLSILWMREGAPDIWFCYHPCFKSPDLIGPELCQSFGIAYVTAEAAHSPRRSKGVRRVRRPMC